MNENIIDVIKGFIGSIYNFMNIPLTWGPYTFSLWKALLLSSVLGVVGWMVGKWLNINKDD